MEHYIVIPQEYVEQLLRSTAETVLSIEEVVDSAIKNYLERMIKNA